MANLNYKHLRYFWMVAKCGSIAAASKELHLTPQSISGQLRELEESLGVDLFRKVGRGLEVTEMGRRIFSYADEIFALGNELLDSARDKSATHIRPFRVGIADSVPKSVAYRVVEPALHLGEAVRLICREGQLASLLAQMAVHRLDMVIADRPMPTNLNVRGYNHLLGQSDLTVFGTARLAQSLPGEFPALLDKAPFLLPGEDVALRPRLIQWFEAQHLQSANRRRVRRQRLAQVLRPGRSRPVRGTHGDRRLRVSPVHVQALGRIDSVVEQLFAITTERRLTNPAIVAIVKATRREVFGRPGS